MNGPFSAEYWKDCDTEHKTLEDEMNVWTLVERTTDMHVLPLTCASKLNIFPDLLLKNSKACFYVQGDQKMHGVDYFETWAPVVHWSTIRTIMILAAKERLILAQCDITATFVHATMPKGEDVYVHQPRGFNRGSQFVLRLNRSLYGMRQSPRYFFKYLTKRLERQGLKPSDLDPCLFMSDKLIVIIYVDDVLV